MIKITYTDDAIEVAGHAGFDQEGKDIVCAAVSAIIFGSVKWFKPKDVVVSQDNRKNKVKLQLKNCNKENMYKLDLIVQLFQPIAQKYKKYVKIQKGR